MKKFGFKWKAMLKLTIVVLLAFSFYPSTEGNIIKDKKSYADSSEIIEELEIYKPCLIESKVNETIQSFVVGAVDDFTGFVTEEECIKAWKEAVPCFADALDACGVHARLRAALIIHMNRFISTEACLESSETE